MSAYRMYIGVDPGLTGSLVALVQTNKGERVIVCRFKGKTRENIDYAIKDLLRLVDKNCVFACVESVHSFSGQGVASSFKFGMVYGEIKGMLTANGVGFEDVTPQKWMKHYEMKRDKEETKTQWKNRLKEKAIHLYPLTKITSDVSDALLIAHYCKQINE